MTVDRTTTDGDKLRLLADWFDRRDSQKAEAFAAGILTEPPDLSQEVQTDLRRMADALDAADHLAEMCRWVAEREPWVTVDPKGRRYRVEPCEVVHACPPGIGGFTPCCQRGVFDLPSTDRIARPGHPHSCPRPTTARLVPLDPEEGQQ